MRGRQEEIDARQDKALRLAKLIVRRRERYSVKGSALSDIVIDISEYSIE